MREVSRLIHEFIRDAGSGHPRFLPNEETLTEIALVELGRRVGAVTVVQKPSRAVESREGHDWVWTVRSPRGFGTMRVQAKKLYPSGRYEKLNHHYDVPTTAGGTSKELQLERLIRTSHAQGHAPVYAMYNGDFGDFAASSVALGHCCRSPLQRHDPSAARFSPLGVTLMDAHWVRYWMPPNPASVPPVPSTADLNSGAIAWECMFCSPATQTSAGGGDDPPGGPGPDGTEPGDAESEARLHRPGLPTDPRSYLLKLLHALFDEDVSTGARAETVGFSVVPPEWLEALEARSEIADAEEYEFFASLEPGVADEDRPDFYVLLDVREDGS